MTRMMMVGSGCGGSSGGSGFWKDLMQSTQNGRANRSTLEPRNIVTWQQRV